MKPSGKNEKSDKKLNKSYETDIYPDTSFVQKILLLGTAQSGKSTVLKQLKILHERNFTFEERMHFKIDIKQNVCESIVQIIDVLQDKNVLSDEDEITQNISIVQHFCKNRLSETSNNRRRLVSLEELLNEEADNFAIEFFEAVHRIWHDTTVQVGFAKFYSELQVMDSAKYYLDKVMSIASSEYIPSNQDILRCRVITTGIYELKFTYHDLQRLEK